MIRWLLIAPDPILPGVHLSAHATLVPVLADLLGVHHRRPSRSGASTVCGWASSGSLRCHPLHPGGYDPVPLPGPIEGDDHEVTRCREDRSSVLADIDAACRARFRTSTCCSDGCLRRLAGRPRLGTSRRSRSLDPARDELTDRGRPGSHPRRGATRAMGPRRGANQPGRCHWRIRGGRAARRPRRMLDRTGAGVPAEHDASWRFRSSGNRSSVGRAVRISSHSKTPMWPSRRCQTRTPPARGLGACPAGCGMRSSIGARSPATLPAVTDSSPAD